MFSSVCGPLDIQILFSFLGSHPTAFCPNFPLLSSAKQCFSIFVSSNDFSRPLVRSNVRKNISSKTKRILKRDISSRVYIDILKGFVQPLMLSSGPKSIICRAFRIEKLVVTALGSVCSEGPAGHASSPFLPTFPSV